MKYEFAQNMIDKRI